MYNNLITIFNSMLPTLSGNLPSQFLVVSIMIGIIVIGVLLLIRICRGITK